MFQINEDKSIYLTRGDEVAFSVDASINDEPYVFSSDDIIRISVYAKKDCTDVVLRKDFGATDGSQHVDITLEKQDTRIGQVISKPTDYWYEIELNPETAPQTIIGYDENGAKVFKLFPESDNFADVVPENIPAVDEKFSISSNRPLSNATITLKFLDIEKSISSIAEKITSKDILVVTREKWEELKALGTWIENTLYVVKSDDDAPDIGEQLTELTAATSKASSDASEAKKTADSAKATAEASAKTFFWNVKAELANWGTIGTYKGVYQEIAVEGIKKDDTPFADINLSLAPDELVSNQNCWSLIQIIDVIADNKIRIYAEKKPEETFTFRLKVVR